MHRADVEQAARNNAWWCHGVAAAAGLTGSFDADAWTCPHRTPVRFPDAVTLRPAATADALLARIDATAGCSVKDSFATLDLAPFGFEVLFEARWIRRPADVISPPPSPASPPIEWRALAAGDVEPWARARSSCGEPGDFDPAWLQDEHVELLVGWRASEPVAGAVVTRAAGVAGLSNVFGPPGSPHALWASCVDAIARRSPHLTVVGYEWGETLAAARASGFEHIGPLRIWHIPKETLT